MLSPLEFAWAPIVACARDIESGLGDEDLEKWLDLFRCSSAEIRIIDSMQKRVWAAQQGREDLVDVGETAKLTPLERIQNVVATKAILEKTMQTSLGAQALSEAWIQNVKVSKQAGKAQEDAIMKPGLIDACLTISNRMLGDPDIEQFLAKTKAWTGGLVFDSIYQLEAELFAALMFAYCGLGYTDSN